MTRLHSLDSGSLGGGGVSDGDKGDVVVSGTGAVWTVDNDAVSNAKLANMADSTIKGRAVGAGTGDPTDLTAAQATAIVASGSGGGTTNFLRADGTWAAPAGGSGLTQPQVMARAFGGC